MAKAKDDREEEQPDDAAPDVVALRVARWKAGDPEYLDDASASDWLRRRPWWRRLRWPWSR